MRVIVVEAVGRITAEMRPRSRAGDGNLGGDQGSGATPAGMASAEAGGADSDRGEWGGRSGAPSSALAEAATAAVKMMPAKAGRRRRT